MSNIVDENILKKLGLNKEQFLKKQAFLRTMHLGVSKAYNDSFRNVVSLNFLNSAIDEMNYQNNMKGTDISSNDEPNNNTYTQHRLNRNTFSRANYYFTITSPDYIKQLFEQDYEDNNEGKKELSSQINTITSFINSVERHLAQGFLDRSSMDVVQERRSHYKTMEDPLTKETFERPHVHGLFKEYFNSSMHETHLFDYLQCPNLKPFVSPLWVNVFNLKQNTDVTTEDLEVVYKSVFESSGDHLSNHIDSCKNMDLQVLFREIFSTKELGREQELNKCKLAEVLSNFNIMKKELAEEIEKNFVNIFQNNSFEETKLYESIASSQAYPWVLPVDQRKSLFINEFKNKNEMDTITFMQNYTLLSSLVKQGGLNYKNTISDETDDDSINGNSDIACTNEIDLKRAQEEILSDDRFTIMEVNIARTPRLLFKEYIENSKKKFLGQYFEDNKISKELFWDNPELQLDFEKLLTAQITERNVFFSVAWANFMEGLINHYMEEEIIPAVESDVCQKMLQPSLKLLYYMKKYDSLQECKGIELKDREIPDSLRKLLKEFDDLYYNTNSEEQDKRLQKFVDQAEKYIELYYIPALVMMLMESMKNYNYLAIKVIEGLGPLFYYLDPELATHDESEEELDEAVDETIENITPDTAFSGLFDVSSLLSKGLPSGLAEQLTKDLFTQIENGGEVMDGQFENYEKFFQQITDNYKQQMHDKSSSSNTADQSNEIITSDESLSKVEDSLAAMKLEQDKIQAEVRDMMSKNRKDKNKKVNDEIDTGFRTFERIFSLAVENKWI